MYNPQLETFIRVADAGSFNKAAEQSYITPTAVIKQINLQEDTAVLCKSLLIVARNASPHFSFYHT